MRPLGGYALLQAKEEGRKISRMRRLVQNIIAYFLFLWLVMALNYASYDWRAYHLNNYTRNTLVSQPYGTDRENTFEGIRE